MKTKKKYKPRGEYRARWDMPHDSKRDYSRSKQKKETREILEELDKEEENEQQK